MRDAIKNDHPMSSVNTLARQPLFDVVKFLMMVWVVWGHLGLYGVADFGDGWQWMFNAKIGVNMPVFFVISGYLAASTFQRVSFPSIFLKVVRFVWPQFIFAFGCGLVWFANSFHFGLFSAVFERVMSFWFLKNFAVVYFLGFIVHRVFRSDIQRWIGFGVCYLAMLFWPSSLRCNYFGQVIHMFPYFVFGLMVLRKREIFRNTAWVVVSTVILVLSQSWGWNSRRSVA